MMKAKLVAVYGISSKKTNRTRDQLQQFNLYAQTPTYGFARRLLTNTK